MTCNYSFIYSFIYVCFRGWFEEEDDFKIMCENELKQAKAFWDKNKPKPKGTSGQGKPAGTGANKGISGLNYEVVCCDRPYYVYYVYNKLICDRLYVLCISK